MADHVSARARQLAHDLNEFKADQFPSGPVRDIYNVILRQAKKEAPDDEVIQSLDELDLPVIKTAACQVNAGSLRAVLTQIADATEPPGTVTY